MAITINANGQTPQFINYQAVARNASGSLIAGQSIGVRLTIHDGGTAGTIQYQETQSVTTNSYGLFTLQIGSGLVISGTMNGITWGNGAKYLQVEVDPAGGSSYTDMGAQQLASVPYSLHAENANSANTLTGTVTMGGDVTGTNSAATVTKLQGNNVSATAPATGQALKWNGTAWTPANDSTTAYSAGTGITLTGTTFSMPNVGTAGSYGSATQVPVITTDAQGRVSGVTNTTITGDNWGTDVAHTDATLAGNGTLGTPLKIAQQGAAAGQALKWNGTAWMPANDSTTTYSASTGLALAGTTFSAQYSNPLWNANELQGKNVSTTAPAIGQVLSWSGSAWTPANDAGTVGSITAGTGLSGGTITTTGTISMPNVGTAGTYGSATQVPVLTTDAQGRVTGVTNTTIPLTSGTITSINTSAPLTGGPITSTGTIGMATSGVTAGSYGSATQTPGITVDAYGRITGASNTTISGTTPGGAAGGDLTGTYPNPTLIATGVTAATYGSATSAPKITVDAKGRITAATSTTITGTTPGGAASGDLSGTYPNPTVGMGAITNAKVATSAAIAYSKLNLAGSVSITDHSATGTASAATFLRGDNTWSTPSTSPTGAAGGDLTGTYPNPTLVTTGVTAGSYGSATAIPTITVDAKGRITVASTNTINPVPAGTAAGDMLYWSGSAWVRVPVGSNGQVLQLTGAVPTWVGTKHNIGDAYGGGIVAYITQPGDPGYSALEQHGLIAATSDQSTGVVWGCSGTFEGATGFLLGTGRNNTEIIYQNCGTSGNASAVCKSYSGGGFTDWYLPSRDELNKLYINRIAIGGFASAYYWSSSENYYSNAWYQYFASGAQNYNDKANTHYVRAVRAF